MKNSLRKSIAKTLFLACLILPSMSTLSAFAAASEPELEKAHDEVKAKHYTKAYAKFKDMGEHDCPFSNCILGVMNQKGEGVKKNIDQAIKYYERSAQLGLADAELHLARLLNSEEAGARKDTSIAMKWLHMAAEHGSAEAQLWLGKLYLKGAPGIKRDAFIAQIWLHKAADQGLSEAKVVLSRIDPSELAKRPFAALKNSAGGSGSAGDTTTVTPQNALAHAWSGYSDVITTLESNQISMPSN
jgi:hypothetical protein